MKKVFNLKENKHLKKAEISIETILIVVLGMMVIFVVFNMFYSSLFKMSTSTKMKSVYEEKSVEEANANNTANYMDPNSQVSVQVMADPDAEIAGYHSGALNGITLILDRYTDNSVPVSESDLRELAKWVTIYQMSEHVGPTQQLNVPNDIYQKMYALNVNNIYVQIQTQKTIINGNQTIDWQSPELYAQNVYNSSIPYDRVRVLSDIADRWPQ